MEKRAKRTIVQSALFSRLLFVGSTSGAPLGRSRSFLVVAGRERRRSFLCVFTDLYLRPQRDERPVYRRFVK